MNQTDQLEEIFQIFDTVGDEKVYINQIGDVLRAMGQNPTQIEIRKLIESYEDEKKRISFDVFQPILQQVSKNKRLYSFEEIVEGLRNFDTDGSGTIGAAELRHLLTSLGEKLTENEVEQLIDPSMIDDEGQVNYEQFVKSIMNA